MLTSQSVGLGSNPPLILNLTLEYMTQLMYIWIEWQTKSFFMMENNDGRHTHTFDSWIYAPPLPRVCFPRCLCEWRVHEGTRAHRVPTHTPHTHTHTHTRLGVPPVPPLPSPPIPMRHTHTHKRGWEPSGDLNVITSLHLHYLCQLYQFHMLHGENALNVACVYKVASKQIIFLPR